MTVLRGGTDIELRKHACSPWPEALARSNPPDLSRLTVLALVRDEFRRAIAAARYYDDLRCSRAPCARRSLPDVPRRIFEMFYAIQTDWERGRGT
jgi:hypothetical protein